jgi:hypothetical protein
VNNLIDSQHHQPGEQVSHLNNKTSDHSILELRVLDLHIEQYQPSSGQASEMGANNDCAGDGYHLKKGRVPKMTPPRIWLLSSQAPP